MNEKVNLQNLIALLAEKSGVSKKEAENFLKAYFHTLGEGLLRDRIVKIKGLGTFKLTQVNERESVDVNNGTRMVIPPHNKVDYVPDTQLAKEVNEPFALFEAIEIEDTESTPLIEEIEAPEHKELEAEKLVDPYHRKYFTSYYINGILIFLLVAFITVEYFYVNFDWENDETTVFEDYDRLIPLHDRSVNVPLYTESDSNFVDTFNIAVEEEKDLLPQEPKTIGVKKRIVQAGERLTLISLEEYGHKSFWIYLYEENKDKITNPDNIPTGIEIVIPPASKYGIDKNDPEAIKKADHLAKK